MLFTSWGFALLIAVLIPLYYAVPQKCKTAVLLLANLVFYAFAGVFALLLLLGTAASVYCFARWIGWLWTQQKDSLAAHREDWDKAQKKSFRERMEKKRRLALALCLILHFGILFGMKYGAGIVGLANGLFGTTWDGTKIVLFMGCSFYTFSAMGYAFVSAKAVRPSMRSSRRSATLTSSAFWVCSSRGWPSLPTRPQSQKR